MSQTRNQQGIAHLGLIAAVIVAVVAAVGVLVYKKQNDSKYSSSGNAPATTQPVKKSAYSGIVGGVSFGSEVDKMGAITKPVSAFKSTDPTIFAAIGLNKSKDGQRVEYVRYLNGKFVDNGSVPIKTGAKYADFKFKLKPNQTHPKGKYLVKTYVDGRYQKSARYEVQ